MSPFDPPRFSRRDALAVALVLGVAVAALGFGGITRPVDLGLHLLAAALVLTALVGRSHRSDRGQIILPLAVAIAVVALPNIASAALSTNPLAGAATAPDPVASWSPWAPTLRGGLAWLRFALLLAVAAVACHHRQHRRLMAAGILLVGGLEVLYGAPRWFAQSTEIWGRTVPGDGSRLRGTFVNPDHLALFLALALSVAFATTWATARNTRFESFDRRIVALVFPLLAWTTLFVALAFTGSRAGLVAVILATVAQGVAIGRGRLLPRLAGVGIVVLGLAAVSWLGLRQGLGRLLSTSAHEVTWNARLEAARAGWDLWLQSPWFGVGIGGFRETFPSVQPMSLAGHWRHVHNDWLELLIETGICGAVVLLVGVGATIVALVRRELPERSEDRAALVAALGALVATGAHELLDFGLTMPANSWTLALILGGGLSAMGPLRQAVPEDMSGEWENDSPGT